MSLGLLLPAGLLALLALSIPLLLHLTRRTEQQAHRVRGVALAAGVRASPAPGAVRRTACCSRCDCCCLPCWRCCWHNPCFPACRVHGTGSWSRRASIAPRHAQRSIAPDADWRWLAPGFPALERETPARLQSTSSLLRELDAALPDAAALTVLVPRRIDGLDGERPALRRKADWRIVDTQDAPAKATPQDPGLPRRALRAGGRPGFAISARSRCRMASRPGDRRSEAGASHERAIIGAARGASFVAGMARAGRVAAGDPCLDRGRRHGAARRRVASSRSGRGQRAVARRLAARSSCAAVRGQRPCDAADA